MRSCYAKAIALNAAGDLFLAENDARIRKIDAGTQVIETIAGNGISGYSGDGGPALNAQLSDCEAIAVDAVGNIYIGDATNRVIRKIDAVSQVITTVAGNSSGTSFVDGALANQVYLAAPAGLALDSQGNLFTNNPYAGMIEIASSSPALPFNWPGTFGPSPVLTETF